MLFWFLILCMKVGFSSSFFLKAYKVLSLSLAFCSFTICLSMVLCSFSACRVSLIVYFLLYCLFLEFHYWDFGPPGPILNFLWFFSPIFISLSLCYIFWDISSSLFSSLNISFSFLLLYFEFQNFLLLCLLRYNWPTIKFASLIKHMCVKFSDF